MTLYENKFYLFPIDYLFLKFLLMISLDSLTFDNVFKSTKNYPAMCVGELYIGFFINILDQLDDKDQIYLIYHQNQCLHVIHTLNYLQ